MTREEALEKVATGWWQTATDAEIVAFQLPEDRLCMPFDRFHQATEAVLGRPVFTHEFARPEWLLAEWRGEREPLDPMDSLRQIVGPDKPIVVVTPAPPSEGPMPDSTPDPWAAAVEAFHGAPVCEGPKRQMEYHDAGCCDDCVALGLRAALPHLIEAVVTEAFPDGQYEHTSAGPIADLRRAAARLTNG